MLTEKSIQRAVQSCTSEVVLNDGSQGKGTGSLRLRIRKNTSGRVSAIWLAWWKKSGRRQQRALGRYPDLGLREARERYAAEVRPVLLAGKSPRHHVGAVSDATLERMFAGYVESMRARGRTSADEVERSLRAAAEYLGPDRLAASVDAGDVSAYLASIYGRGSRVMADRMRAYLTAAWNWAIHAEHDYTARVRQAWGLTTNPAAAVGRDSGAGAPRDRVLSPTELRALWRAVEGPGFAPDTALAVRLLIACGQRVRETLRMTAADLDLDAGIWRMPAAKTKGRSHAHVVPLPSIVIADLQGHRSFEQTSASINRALRRWSRASGVPDFQARDLRRTWKTQAAAAGIDRFTRDLIQQHARGDTGSLHYDRADYIPATREAMSKWDAWLRANC